MAKGLTLGQLFPYLEMDKVDIEEILPTDMIQLVDVFYIKPCYR